MPSGEAARLPAPPNSQRKAPKKRPPPLQKNPERPSCPTGAAWEPLHRAGGWPVRRCPPCRAVLNECPTVLLWGKRGVTPFPKMLSLSEVLLQLWRPSCPSTLSDQGFLGLLSWFSLSEGQYALRKAKITGKLPSPQWFALYLWLTPYCVIFPHLRSAGGICKLHLQQWNIVRIITQSWISCF